MRHSDIIKALGVSFHDNKAVLYFTHGFIVTKEIDKVKKYALERDIIKKPLPNIISEPHIILSKKLYRYKLQRNIRDSFRAAKEPNYVTLVIKNNRIVIKNKAVKITVINKRYTTNNYFKGLFKHHELLRFMYNIHKGRHHISLYHINYKWLICGSKLNAFYIRSLEYNFSVFNGKIVKVPRFLFC